MFASALAMVSLVTPLAGFGLEGYWLYIYGREGASAQRWMPASLRFLLISVSLVVGGVLLWAWLGPHDSLTSSLLCILTVFVIGQVVTVLTHAKYQLEGRQSWLAIWQVLPHFLRFTGIAALVLFLGGQSITAVHSASIFAVVGVILLALGGYQVARLLGGGITLDGHPDGEKCLPKGNQKPVVTQVLAGAWPYGLAGIFYLIYFQSDIILIKYLVGDSEAGIYNVAFVVMSAIYLLPSVFYQKFLLPKLHRWAHHDQGKLIDAYRFGNVAMLSLGIIIMTILWLLVPLAIPLLFGKEYDAAVALLTILAIAVPLRFLASSAGAMLVTRNYIRTKIKVMGLAAVLNVILNLALIPKFGMEGAAVATVVTELCLAAMYQLFFRKCLAADRGFLS